MKLFWCAVPRERTLKKSARKYVHVLHEAACFRDTYVLELESGPGRLRVYLEWGVHIWMRRSPRAGVEERGSSQLSRSVIQANQWNENLEAEGNKNRTRAEREQNGSRTRAEQARTEPEQNESRTSKNRTRTEREQNENRTRIGSSQGGSSSATVSVLSWYRSRCGGVDLSRTQRRQKPYPAKSPSQPIPP